MAAVNFSIRVVDENGHAISGAEVYLHRTPLLDVWSDTRYTDYNGWTNCEYDDCFGCDKISLGVDINGENMGEYIFCNGASKSFTI
jgi:hypothetical protein